MPKPGASPFCSRCASVARGAAGGAGNSQIEPSVKTPSTSNRMILIFLARSRDMKRLTPAWNDLVIIKPQHHGCDWDQSELVLRKSDPELGEGEGPLRCLTICGQCKFAHRVET